MVAEEVDTILGAAAEAAELAAEEPLFQRHTTKLEEPEEQESLI